MKLDDLYAATVHLQKALNLFIEARREEIAARDGIARIRRLRQAVREAHQAGDTQGLEQLLEEMVDTAAENLKQANATTRYESIAAAIGAMCNCLAGAMPHGVPH